MPLSRLVWIDKVRSSLELALGEFAKQKFADLVGYSRDGSEQINELLRDSRRLCAKETKTKSQFDRKEAFAEAVSEASIAQVQVFDGKQRLLNYNLTPEQRQIIERTVLKAEDLMREMLERFPVEI
jgi:Spy/CpxP family protein refolding chaperone